MVKLVPALHQVLHYLILTHPACLCPGPVTGDTARLVLPHMVLLAQLVMTVVTPVHHIILTMAQGSIAILETGGMVQLSTS